MARLVGTFLVLLLALLWTTGCHLLEEPEDETDPIPGDFVSSANDVERLDLIGSDSLLVQYSLSEPYWGSQKYILELSTKTSYPYPTWNGIPCYDIRNGYALGFSPDSGMVILYQGEVIGMMPYAPGAMLNNVGSGVSFVSDDTLFVQEFKFNVPRTVFVIPEGYRISTHLWVDDLVYFGLHSYPTSHSSTTVRVVNIKDGSLQSVDFEESYLNEHFSMSSRLFAVSLWHTELQTRELRIFDGMYLAFSLFGRFSGVALDGDTLYYYGRAEETLEYAILRLKWR